MRTWGSVAVSLVAVLLAISPAHAVKHSKHAKHSKSAKQSSTKHADTKAALLGCWSQDAAAIIQDPDKEYTIYTICFRANNNLSESSAPISQKMLEFGNSRRMDAGQADPLRTWSAWRGTLEFTPITRASGLKQFSCDFALSDPHEKLNLRNCTPSGDDWNGAWIFEPILSE